jgi:hypothetical protein
MALDLTLGFYDHAKSSFIDGFQSQNPVLVEGTIFKDDMDVETTNAIANVSKLTLATELSIVCET